MGRKSTGDERPGVTALTPSSLGKPVEFMGMQVLNAMGNYSRQLLSVSRQLAVESLSDAPLKTERPMASVILTVTGLDAYLNEDIAIVGSSGRCEQECADLQRSGAPLDERWSRFMEALGLTIDRGRRPFTTLKKMVCLRNVLVHRAARFRRVDEFPDPVIADLEKTKEFTFASDSQGGNLSWCQRMLNPACARWAFNTAIDTCTEHVRLRGVSTFHPPFIDLPRIP